MFFVNPLCYMQVLRYKQHWGLLDIRNQTNAIKHIILSYSTAATKNGCFWQSCVHRWWSPGQVELWVNPLCFDSTGPGCNYKKIVVFWIWIKIGCGWQLVGIISIHKTKGPRTVIVGFFTSFVVGIALGKLSVPCWFTPSFTKVRTSSLRIPWRHWFGS